MSDTITRMLPFRQYNENDVINMFSLDTITGEAGSLVKISSANLDLDPVSLIERSDSLGYQNYLGNASSLYPEVPYKVTKVANTGERPIGILLKDVRSVDENGELSLERLCLSLLAVCSCLTQERLLVASLLLSTPTQSLPLTEH
jgi:hypothetical protein